MSKLILFSLPTEKVMSEIVTLIFPSGLKNKVMGYMGAEGSITREKFRKYEDMWQNIAHKNDSEFVFIDNAIDSNEERKKLEQINILYVTGGNGCQLLKNVRENKFDKPILDFLKRENTIYAGFSAGAMLVTPSMELANFPPFDENKGVGIKDFTCLNLVDFEIYAHYSDEEEGILEKYKKHIGKKVVPLTNDDYLYIDN